MSARIKNVDDLLLALISQGARVREESERERKFYWYAELPNLKRGKNVFCRHIKTLGRFDVKAAGHAASWLTYFLGVEGVKKDNSGGRGGYYYVWYFDE